MGGKRGPEEGWPLKQHKQMRKGWTQQASVLCRGPGMATEFLHFQVGRPQRQAPLPIHVSPLHCKLLLCPHCPCHQGTQPSFPSALMGT